MNNVKSAITPIKSNAPTNIDIGIHNGLVTHHHDQFATGSIFANFNTRKIKNNGVVKFILTNAFSFVILVFIIVIHF